MYKDGDEVLIKAKIKLIEDKPQGNLIRVETTDSHVIIWATASEVVRGDDHDD